MLTTAKQLSDLRRSRGRSRTQRAARAWVRVPRLLLAGVLWLIIGAATPWPGGWNVLAMLATGVITCLLTEPVKARLRGRPPADHPDAAATSELVYSWLALPWTIVATIGTDIGRRLNRLPLVGFAWKTRPVVTAIAIVQSIATGHHGSAAIITLVIGLTYALPWTLRHDRPIMRRQSRRVSSMPSMSDDRC